LIGSGEAHVPELSFRVTEARAVDFAAAPTIALSLEIRNAQEHEPIQSVLLQAQVRIQAAARSYTDKEREGLRELFGEPERWGRTLRGLLWTQATTVVRPFAGTGVAELLLPCTFDFNVAAAKYFNAVEGGVVPLLLLFSGTVFHSNSDGALQAAPIPWNSEGGFFFPVDVWRQTLERHFPNRASLELQRDVLDRLYRYQVDRGLMNLDAAVDALLIDAAPPGRGSLS
jgi:hypothetical protein